MKKKKLIEGDVVRYGVIGVGGMGQGHCKTLRNIEEAELTCVCDVDVITAEKVGQEHDVRHFTDYKDLLRAGLCDAVLIVTEHPPRPPIAIDAMKAGLHVLSEKPLSERISSADKMIAAAKEYNVAFAVDFQRRAEPAFEKAAEIVRSGQLGKLYRRTMISPEYRSQAYYDSGGWRATWIGEGGGVMMNQSPHIIDMFILLGGMPNRVLGKVETRLHNIEVEDLAEAMLEYPDGGTGYFYCSTNEVGPGQMIELFGDKGKLCWRNGELQHWRYEPASVAEFTRNSKQMWGGLKCIEVPLELTEKQTGHGNIISNFTRHLLHGDELIAPGEDGIHSLELANAVWLSAHRNKPVDLPLSRRAYDNFLNKMRRESTFQKKVNVDERITDPRHQA